MRSSERGINPRAELIEACPGSLEEERSEGSGLTGSFLLYLAVTNEWVARDFLFGEKDNAEVTPWQRQEVLIRMVR